MSSAAVESQLDPLFCAQSQYRRRHFDLCVSSCSSLLRENPLDQAVWLLKTRALVSSSWVDDTELEEEGVAELLLDENAMASVPRPGTSISAPVKSSYSFDPSIRPMTTSGRPLTGFSRSGLHTSSRGASGSRDLSSAFQGARPGTSRPMTSFGRQFIDVDHLDLTRFSEKPTLSKALCEYLLTVVHNPRKALELASKVTSSCNFRDWWWKVQLGRCYYQLSLYRDAEKQFKSALKDFNCVSTILQLSKVYYRLDLPNNAKDLFTQSLVPLPRDVHLKVGVARVFEALGDMESSTSKYREVLKHDPSCVEAMSSLAAHYFYEDQPEASLKLYRRLLQTGFQSAELWNNIGLCCYYSNQYDLSLPCFEKGLQLSDNKGSADLWFNLSVVCIGLGQEGLAYQCLKIAMCADNSHSESFNNLGVLEVRKSEFDAARSNYKLSQKFGDHLFEPFFNGALLAYKMGDFQESYSLVQRSLQIYPDSIGAKELFSRLNEHFCIV